MASAKLNLLIELAFDKLRYVTQFEQVGGPSGIMFLPAGIVPTISLSEQDRSDWRCSARPGEQIATLSDDDELVETLAVARRARARADAMEARALVRLNELRTGSPSVPKEASLELRISPQYAAARLDRAEALVRRMPRLLAAMESGQIEGFPAGRITDTAAGLSEDDAREVDAQLAVKLEAGRIRFLDPTSLVRAARRLVEKVDPDGQAERARAARAGRKVELVTREDSMASLRADLPAEVAASAYARLDAMARKLRNRGDERTLDQLRADLCADLLLGNDPGVEAPQEAATVFLHMPVDTALLMSDHGCELAGYGPVPAAVAREIMTSPGSAWRKVLTDPVTGAPTSLGRRRRRPNALIRDLVAARDMECAVPGCHRPAARADFDHLQDWAQDGATSVANGAAKCRRDHRRKDEPGWHLEYSPLTGASTISTPAGRTYTQTRHTVVEPRESTRDRKRTWARTPEDIPKQRPAALPRDDPPF